MLSTALAPGTIKVYFVIGIKSLSCDGTVVDVEHADGLLSRAVVIDHEKRRDFVLVKQR